MEAEARMALGTLSSEKRIEGLLQHLLRHSPSIVRKAYLHLLSLESPRVDQDAAAMGFGETMDRRIGHQVSQYLSVRTRIAVHDDAVGNLDRKRELRRPQAWAQTRDDLPGREFEIEGAPVGAAAIDSDL